MNLVALTNNDLLTRFVKTLDLRAINPGNLMVSLHRGFPGNTGENEASGTYYQRQSCLFAPAGSGQIKNANQLQFFKRSGEAVITETLFYTDNFNRPNVGYCAGSVGGNWSVYTGCAGIELNKFKMGLNISQPVRCTWDKAGAGIPALAGQFTRARLRSWYLRPQMGLVLMAQAPDVAAPSLSGYTAMIHPGPTPGIIDPVVRIYRPGPTSSQELIAQEGVTGHPMAEWTFTALPFVDHTFLQVKREGNTVIEVDDYGVGRLSSGWQGLNVRHDLYGDQDLGCFVYWEDWEAGGAELDIDGGGGSPDVLITHLGFWTADQTLFLGSARFNSSIHLLVNQKLTIEIDDLILTVTTGDASSTDAFKEKHLDRFGRGINFTTAPLQFSLHTADPGTTGANEISGSRITVPVEAWDVADQQVTTNGTRIDFPNIPTNVITHIGVRSLEGEFLLGAELSAPINASLPVQTVRFLQGRLKFTVPTNATGFLTADGSCTVDFHGVGIAVGAASMAGVGAAAFSSAAVKPGALSAAGAATTAFVGKETFPGWNTWTNRSPSVAGFINIRAISDGTTRIYYSRSVATSSLNCFSSLLKSDLTTHTVHTLPSNQAFMASIAPMDDGDTVFLGSGSTSNTAIFWRFLHSGGFTDLSWPGPSSDALFVVRHPTDSNILFVSNQSGSSDDVQLYEYNISGATFTKIAGTGVNSSWNKSGSNRSCEACTFDVAGDFIYAVQRGGTANEMDVWRSPLTGGYSWTRIGGAGLNSSWATGTKRNGTLKYSPATGVLYAFIGGSTAGDAEVWACTNPGTSPAWTQVGGDSINSSWAAGNFVNCSRITQRSNRLVTALAGSASGDSEVWEYDEIAATWTKIGGDGVDSSWSTLSSVVSVHIDREDRLWASPTSGTSGTPQLWSKSVA